MGFEDLIEAIVNGDENQTSEIVERMLDEGFDPKEIINKGIILAMNKVGTMYEKAEIFLPEMIVSADATQVALAKLKPLLGGEKVGERKKAVFATVKGDQHNIGKNLACMVFRGSGYEVTDLGVDVPPEKIAKAVDEVGADVVGLSTLLTTTMEEMRNAIKLLEKSNLRDKVTVVIGGAPLTENFAREIGADVYGESPFEAVRKLRNRA